MTICKKIFLLAGILLALFGVVVGALATIQKLDSDQIGNIVDYELPLSRLVAEFDVDTDRYELGILRVLLLDPASPVGLQAPISAMRALTDELRKDTATAATLLDRAIRDSKLSNRGSHRPGAHRGFVQVPQPQPRRLPRRRRARDGCARRWPTRGGADCLARLR